MTRSSAAGRPLIMQSEATMAATTAVMEMLAHTRRGVLHIFPAVPQHWQSASFEGLRVEGAFLVSAWRESRQTRRIEIASEAGATLTVVNPFSGPMKVRRPDGRSEVVEGDVVEITTSAGETLMLTPAHTPE
jgi:alpha-L-fucosidase 2